MNSKVLSLLFIVFWKVGSLRFSNNVPLSPKDNANKVGFELLRIPSLIASVLYFPSLSKATNEGGKGRLSTNEFASKWPYQKPSDILDFVYDYAKDGDADAVIQAMDIFASVYPMYKLTPMKAAVLSKEVAQFSPKHVLELGTFFGYSAIHIAKNMPKTCTLTCIEGNSDNVAVTQAILRRCFEKTSPDVLARVNVLHGLSTAVIGRPDFHDLLFPSESSADPTIPTSTVDFLFLDHDKDCYLPDLRTLDKKGLLGDRCEVIADNVVFPGAPGYLEFVGGRDEADGIISLDDNRQSSRSNDINFSSGNEASDKDADTTKRQWRTRLEQMPFERVGFETQFKEVQDAMSVSYR